MPGSSVSVRTSSFELFFTAGCHPASGSVEGEREREGEREVERKVKYA